jgi:hypothetical protein
MHRATQAQVGRKRVAPKKKLSSATLFQGWLFIFGLIMGVGAIGFVATKLFLNPSYQTAQAELAIAVAQPAIELPPPPAKPSPAPAPAKPKVTFNDKSQQVIQKWLESKSAAFGKEHKTEALTGILAEPLLTTWRDRSVIYQQDNTYREYQHQIKLRSAKIDPQNPSQATVEAEVQENARHYRSGQLDNAQSYNDNLLVRYKLILKGENWLIQNAEVLKTL